MAWGIRGVKLLSMCERCNSDQQPLRFRSPGRRPPSAPSGLPSGFRPALAGLPCRELLRHRGLSRSAVLLSALIVRAFSLATYYAF